MRGAGVSGGCAGSAGFCAVPGTPCALARCARDGDGLGAALAVGVRAQDTDALWAKEDVGDRHRTRSPLGTERDSL